jgi:5-(carboxyamino)imidazole ribonucleotide mutase
MTAAKTSLPVIGVPIRSKSLNGLDSLLSIVQMPPGVPVATMAIDGAVNAALFASRIVALRDEGVAQRIAAYAATMHDAAASSTPQ